MTLAVFPTLKGLSLPVKRTPMFKTSAQPAASGRETRLALQSFPRYRYELIFEFLRAGSQAEYQSLLGFYNLRGGSANYFAFSDPDDNTATDEPLGTGDGVTTDFQLIRAFGAYIDPIFVPVGTPTIKINTIGTSNFTLGPNGLIIFNSAPANNAALTWSGTFRWLCRFVDDSLEFQKDFMTGLDGGPIWSAAKCAFMTEKP